jgi:hypothetical protein
MNPQPQWQQEAARLGGAELVRVLGELRDGQVELMANMDQMSAKATKSEAAITRLLSGFPADDVEGHRRYHESVIEWRELRNKLVREALIKLAGAGALATAGILITLAWQTFKIKVTQ